MRCNFRDNQVRSFTLRILNCRYSPYQLEILEQINFPRHYRSRKTSLQVLGDEREWKRTTREKLKPVLENSQEQLNTRTNPNIMNASLDAERKESYVRFPKSRDLRKQIESQQLSSVDLEKLSPSELIHVAFYSEKVCRQIISFLFHDRRSSLLAKILDDEETYTMFLRLGYHLQVAEEMFIRNLSLRGVNIEPDTTVKQHQIKAIKWMKQCEASRFFGLRGGIIALLQGLGKTFCATLHHLTSPRDIKGFPALVICDTSLLQSWMNDITKHFGNSVKVFIYHPSHYKKMGSIDRDTILEYDFVITTYGICRQIWSELNYPAVTEDMLMDVPSATGGRLLYNTPWSRIFADEAQKFCNHKTATFKSLVALSGRFKWCMTGTPLKNYDTDIWAELRFCGYNGTPNPKDWSIATFKYHNLDNHILRMNYKDAGIKLPEKKEIKMQLELSKEERKCYDECLLSTRAAFGRMKDKEESFSNVLAHFCRLRQAAIASYLICPQAKRKHDDEMSNPLDKMNLSNETKRWIVDKNGAAGIHSTKLKALMDILRNIPSSEKTIVFSMFTSALDLALLTIQKHLGNDVKVLVIEGSLSEKERNQALEKFRSSDEYNILLCTYGTGGVGLNLVEATHCILLEGWWNQIVTEQASARIHRIGQDKPVTIYQLFIKDSIEEMMAAMCEQKSIDVENFMNSSGVTKKKNAGLTKQIMQRLLYHSKSRLE